MFWNDPMLYGASFPYKDFPYRDINFPVQTPFTGQVMPPWQAHQRFAQPSFGYTPQYLNIPTMGVNPYLQTGPVNPYLQAGLMNPYFQTGINPLLNQQQPGWNRPFTF